MFDFILAMLYAIEAAFRSRKGRWFRWLKLGRWVRVGIALPWLLMLTHLVAGFAGGHAA